MSRAKIEELIQLVATGPEAVRNLGLNYGFVLGNKGDVQIAADYGEAVRVRTSLPFHDPTCSQAFVRGYLECIRDISTSYVLGHEERLATDPDALARWVESCDGALQIMKLASERTVIRLDEVSEHLGVEQESRWSQLLYEMRRRRILMPLPGPDSRTHPQSLTLLGVRVLETLERREQSAASSEQLQRQLAILRAACVSAYDLRSRGAGGAAAGQIWDAFSKAGLGDPTKQSPE